MYKGNVGSFYIKVWAGPTPQLKVTRQEVTAAPKVGQIVATVMLMTYVIQLLELMQ